MMEQPVGAALDRSLGSPTAPGEAIEAELDAFICRRDKERVKGEGERRAEETWAASERAYFARRDAEMREAWCVSTTGRRPPATGASWSPR
jgi:hypothetical protein